MNRRDCLAGLVALPAVAMDARAQAISKIPIVGLLSALPAPTDEDFAKYQSIARFRQLGWIDGHSFRIERAFSGHEDRLAQFARGLVAKRVDVIWALGPEAALAAAEATTAIPIVFWGVGYPVEQGLVDSLARPGRNVTGVTVFDGIGVYQKQLEVLREILPGLTRVAWIRTPSAIRALGGGQVAAHAPIFAAAKTLGVTLKELQLHSDKDVNSALTEIRHWRPEAMWVFGTMMTLRHRTRILEFATSERIPGIYFDRSWVELGGLVSYGANGLSGIWRSAELVDRILHGAKPAELPVEMPSTYELAVNLKTAGLLNVKIPQSLVARADRVIE